MTNPTLKSLQGTEEMATKTMTIEIPVVVGSNGEWCANGYTSTKEDGPDWAFMVENLQGDDGKYPATHKHFIVRATVFVPDEEPEVVTGAASESSA